MASILQKLGSDIIGIFIATESAVIIPVIEMVNVSGFGVYFLELNPRYRIIEDKIMEFIAVLVALLGITAVVAYLLGRNTARTEILSRHAALETENLRVCHELDSSCRTINNLRTSLLR